MEPPKIWRESRERYLAIGIECTDCKSKSFPISISCPKCGSKNIKEYKISRTGKVLHFTNVTQTSPEMNFYTPFNIGIIELDDEIKITGQIVDCENKEIKEGMKVRMVFRVLAKDGNEGLIKYGFKFAPI
ncbi:MAG: Zn-ribbon domain-containing OB-fold protein [Candidatus Heimdallarchaeaceae archaeon]|jgi:uncharacterized OB-fold protein